MGRPAFRRTLWDRLVTPELDPETTETKVLMRDLENMLSTRAAYPIYKEFEPDDPLCATLPCYGLKDVRDPESISALDPLLVAQEIRDALVNFEPRLQDIRVEYIEEEKNRRKFTLMFTVTAHVRDSQNSVSERIALDVSTGFCKFEENKK